MKRFENKAVFVIGGNSGICTAVGLIARERANILKVTYYNNYK